MWEDLQITNRRLSHRARWGYWCFGGEFSLQPDAKAVSDRAASTRTFLMLSQPQNFKDD